MKLALLKSASRLSNTRGLTAIVLTVVFGWMMVQPSLALRAQGTTSNNPDGARTTKSRKKKKSKRSDSKAEDKRIILPPQIFNTTTPQQPATVNTQTSAVEQKAKPLSKPTGVKPAAKGSGDTYNAVSRQIESAGQVDFAAMAKKEALDRAKAEA